MGKEVHDKGYIPEYYAMGDPSKDAGNFCPFQYEDKTIIGKFHIGSKLRYANVYGENDKEVVKAVKQMMLEHDEIFRRQVFELHRLYRTQRVLMDEMRKKKEQTFCVKMHLSESFSIKKLTVNQEESSYGHGLPSERVNPTRTSVSGIKEPFLRFLTGSTSQDLLVSREREGGLCGVNEPTEFNTGKTSRRMFDLHLPADAYFDDEDAEQTTVKNLINPIFGHRHPNKVDSVFIPEDVVKLTLGTSQNHVSKTETPYPGPPLQKNLHHKRNMVDLNEPHRELSSEEVVFSSCSAAVQMIASEGLQDQCVSRSAAESFYSQKDIFDDMLKCQGKSTFLNLDRSEKGCAISSSKNEMGKSSSHVNYFMSAFSQTNARTMCDAEIKNKSDQDFPSFLSVQRSETKSGFTEKLSQCNEFSNVSLVTNTKLAGSAVPTVSDPFPVLPRVHNVGGAPSQFSCSTNPSLPVESFPWFSGSTVNDQSRSSNTPSQNISDACEKWQCPQSSRSTLPCGHKACFFPNGFPHSFQPQSCDSFCSYLPSVLLDKPEPNNDENSTPVKQENCEFQNHVKALDFTEVQTAYEVNTDLVSQCGYELQDASNGKMPSATMRKGESTPEKISCLKIKSPCQEQLSMKVGVKRDDVGVEYGSSPLMSNYPTLCKIDEKETENISYLDVIPLIFKAGGKAQQNATPRTSNSIRILGFPLPDLDLQKKVVSDLRNHLSVTCAETSMDWPRSLQHTSDEKDQLFPTFPVQKTAATAPNFGLIDLEAPIHSPVEQILPTKSAGQSKTIISLVEPDSQEDVILGTETVDKKILRAAAATLHSMACYEYANLEDIAVSPSALLDTLNWFADVVTFHSKDLDASREGEQGSSDIDGMDYFEYMTLNSIHVKVDEYYPKPIEVEVLNDETDFSHLLLTKPRRGQARRRRQKRDFQKDILPGLASLPRHEVIKDMQILEGLMKASGQSWQVGGSKRSSGRNQTNSQKRGRGRRRGTLPAAPVMEVPLEGDQKQPSNAEANTDGGNIVGWGRTTRRCWRQRCSSGSILVSPPA